MAITDFIHDHAYRAAGDVALPRIRTITTNDVWEALAAGFRDFKERPTHFVFLGIIYPLLGLGIAQITVGASLLQIVYPLVAGFALIGPFAAIGIYEISRRREQGLDPAWTDAFAVAHSPAIRSIGLLALMLTVAFVVWILAAQTIYAFTLGDYVPATYGEFFTRVLTTPSGWALIVLGNGVGFVFACAVLALTVVSFPMVLDRLVDASTAMRTSLQAVRLNPAPMALWGMIVAGLLVLGSIPLFVGLAVVVPILGHATWHLYRHVIAA